MQGNDLSSRTTPRYWVTASVVVEVEYEHIPHPWPIRLFKPTRTVQRITPRPAALSEIWKFSSTHGVRMELLLIGDWETTQEHEITTILDSYANPFNSVVCYHNLDAVKADLGFRPDVVGVVDENSMRWGGLGLDIRGLR